MFERADFLLKLTAEMIGATSIIKTPTQKKPIRWNKPQKPVNFDLRTLLEIPAVKQRANMESILHRTLVKFPSVDTQVKAFQHCWTRLLAFRAAVHCHKHHFGIMSGDINSGG